MNKSKFDNDVLTLAVNETKTSDDYFTKGFKLLGAIAEAPTELVCSIKDFEGTKVFINCTETTPIVEIVKKFLCTTDLIILTPSPIFPSCNFSDRNLLPFRDFSDANFSFGGKCSADLRLMKNIVQLLEMEPRLISDGAVTFLPRLGDYRWEHSDIKAPELPRPYSDIELVEEKDFIPQYLYDESGKQISKSIASFKMFENTRYKKLNDHQKILLEAAYTLCHERVVAESFNAAHVNPNSFTKPIINDLKIGKNTSDYNWSQALLQIEIPAVDTLDMGDILAVRRELPEAFSSFSKAVIRDLNLTHDKNFTTYVNAVSENIKFNAENLNSQLKELSEKSSILQQKLIGKVSTILLATGGAFGKLSSLITFLMGGGLIWDLFDFTKLYRKDYLKIQEDSFFFAAQLLRKEEESRDKQIITRLNIS